MTGKIIGRVLERTQRAANAREQQHVCELSLQAAEDEKQAAIESAVLMEKAGRYLFFCLAFVAASLALVVAVLKWGLMP